MPELSPSLIIGSWRIIRADPPSSDLHLWQRFLHFTPDGLHYWEHPFATGYLPPLCAFRYHMTERGVFITPQKQTDGWELPFNTDSGCLVFTNASGDKRWWLKRITALERPEYLTHYYEAPTEPNVA